MNVAYANVAFLHTQLDLFQVILTKVMFHPPSILKKQLTTRNSADPVQKKISATSQKQTSIIKKSGSYWRPQGNTLFNFFFLVLSSLDLLPHPLA